jgi:SagB-type dehydrogenase family enzyme
MPDAAPTDPARAAVWAYHTQSKHSFERYAPGPARLDWDAQPEPFRRFEGCERLELPLAASAIDLPFAALYTPGAVQPQPLGVAAIGACLELSLAVSAWKAQGPARWAVRCNPSSGNLHPVEGYLVLPSTDLGPAGIYHYEARDHALELRCGLGPDLAACLEGLLPPGCLLVGLSLVPWREAWKYGVRAWRYCQLDLGHAIGALGYAAACIGWRMRCLTDWPLPDVARLLGLDRAADFAPDESEYPAGLLLLGPDPAALPPQADLLARLPHQAWQGKANRLDRGKWWDAVDAMARLESPACPSPHPPHYQTWPMRQATCPRCRSSAAGAALAPSIRARTLPQTPFIACWTAAGPAPAPGPGTNARGRAGCTCCCSSTGSRGSPQYLAARQGLRP